MKLISIEGRAVATQGENRATPGRSRQLRACPDNKPLQRLIGSSPCMVQLRAQILRVAQSDRPVLISGPSGSGKELVATAVHHLGLSRTEPLLDLNCASFSEPLVDSQLFGHERGTFTGAYDRHIGFLEAVQEGTLFLDEIAELPLPLQAKLLRVLETRRFRRIGATTSQQFRGRVIAATHTDLAESVREGRFREDLFYRLNVLPLCVPPLNQRRGDIPELAAYFLEQQPRPLQLTADALATLCARDWSGNVRQLSNTIERLAVFAETDIIDTAMLNPLIKDVSDATPSLLQTMANRLLHLPLANKLTAVQDALVLEALRLKKGNKSAAAKLLGVHRKVVERRVGKAPSADVTVNSHEQTEHPLPSRQSE